MEEILLEGEDEGLGVGRPSQWAMGAVGGGNGANGTAPISLCGLDSLCADDVWTMS